MTLAAMVLQPMEEGLRRWGYDVKLDGDRLLWPNRSDAAVIIADEIRVSSSVDYCGVPPFITERLELPDGWGMEDAWKAMLGLLKEFKDQGFEVPRINKGMDVQSSSHIRYADAHVTVYGNSVHAWLNHTWEHVGTMYFGLGDKPPSSREEIRAIAYGMVKDAYRRHQAERRSAARIENDFSQILNLFEGK